MTLYQARMADIVDVESFAANLPEEYLKCRVWQHSHASIDERLATKAERAKVPEARWAADLICMNNCGVRWLVLADAEGYIIARKPDYSGAPDYVMVGKGRVGRAGNAVIRKTLFTNNTKAKKGRKTT